MQKDATPPLSDSAAQIARAAVGDGEAFERLAKQMAPMMQSFANRFRDVPGLETEDLLQEGLLGLLAAVHAYREQDGAFAPFAAVCIRNRMRSLLRQYKPGEDAELSDGDVALAELPDAGQADPAALLVAQEEARRLFAHLRERLTTLEYRVLTAFLGGKRYKEIADVLAISEKTVDNALQRVRQKLSKDGFVRQ